MPNRRKSAAHKKKTSAPSFDASRLSYDPADPTGARAAAYALGHLRRSSCPCHPGKDKCGNHVPPHLARLRQLERRQAELVGRVARAPELPTGRRNEGGLLGGYSARAAPACSEADRSEPRSEVVLERLASLLIDPYAERIADREVRISGEPARFPGKPPPLDLAGARASLKPTLCDQDVVRNTNPNPGTVPSLENRAYVAASHGCGFRYNWTIQRDISSESLCETVTSRRDAGWRVGYIALSSSYVDRYNPRFDITWVRDDDCNFNSGVLFVHVQDLTEMHAAMQEAGRRPIYIIYSGLDLWDGGFFTIVWIEDGKYANVDDWALVMHLIDDPEPSFTALGEQGYRAVSATLCAPYVVAVLVRDQYRYSWAVSIRFTDDNTFDPIEKFKEDFSDKIIPICMEGKVYGYSNPSSDGIPDYFAWLIVASEDLDLETATAPGARWSTIPFIGSLPDENEEALLKLLKWRVHCFASAAHETGPFLERRYVQVRAQQPRLHCRVWYDVDPGQKGFVPDELAAVEDFVFARLEQTNTPSVAVAVQDGFSWRLRAAYTRAPLSYPDAYPELPFRTGSTAKIFAAIAAWVALEEFGLDESQLVFPLLPPDLQPSTEPFNLFQQQRYPEGVLSVAFGHCIQQVTGWTGAHPIALGPRAIVDGVSAVLPMSGWQAVDGRGLLPYVRDDWFKFVLRSEVFEAAGLDVNDVGWRLGSNVPPNKAGYAAFNYALLGYAVESLVGAIDTKYVSGPRENFAGLARWTADRVFAPLGMKHSYPSTTIRVPGSDEVVYRAGTYLEEGTADPAGSSPVAETLLYDINEDLGSDCDHLTLAVGFADPDTENGYGIADLPPYVRTPPYALLPYSTYPLESTLPFGGWSSSVVDMCLLLRAYSLFSPILSAQTVGKVLLPPGGGATYNLGGLQSFTLGYLGKGGDSIYSRAAAQLNDITGRKIAVAGNSELTPIFTLSDAFKILQ